MRNEKKTFVDINSNTWWSEYAVINFLISIVKYKIWVWVHGIWYAEIENVQIIKQISTTYVHSQIVSYLFNM